MKALTLWQPWASLCVLPLHDGDPVKMIETRSWRAPDSLLGERLAIHAAKRDPYGHGSVGPFTMFRFGPIRGMKDLSDPGSDSIELPVGAVVGTAVVAGCVEVVEPTHPLDQGTVLVLDDDGMYLRTCEVDNPIGFHAVSVEDERPFGIYEVGRWAWLLVDVERFEEPIPAVGRQGLWNWDPPCTGAGNCGAVEHIHGCFADDPCHHEGRSA